MIDLSSDIKDHVVAFLGYYPRLAQLIPAERIYALQVPVDPEWPFIAYGTPINTPFEDNCHYGTESRITISAFVAGEDNAGLAGKIIVEALNGLPPAAYFRIHSKEYLTTRIQQHPTDADRWRVMVEFSITAISVK